MDLLLNTLKTSITNRSKAIILLWFSVTCFSVFGVRVSVTFHLMCVHIIFSSVSVAKVTKVDLAVK